MQLPDRLALGSAPAARPGSAGRAARRGSPRVCARPSSTVSTRHRFSSSSSISAAVVVRSDHHRPLDVILLGAELAGGRILGGRGDRQLALALQELQRVAGSVRPFFLGDGEQLVLQVPLAHVEQALSGHRRVDDAILFRHERSTPSINVHLPAALVLWINSASGESSLRLMQAR